MMLFKVLILFHFIAVSLATDVRDERYSLEVLADGTLGPREMVNTFVLSSKLKTDQGLLQFTSDVSWKDFWVLPSKENVIQSFSPLHGHQYEFEVLTNEFMGERFDCNFQNETKKINGIVNSDLRIVLTCKARGRMCIIVEGLELKKDEEPFVVGSSKEKIILDYGETFTSPRYHCFPIHEYHSDKVPMWNVRVDQNLYHSCEMIKVTEEDQKLKETKLDWIVVKIRCKSNLN